MASGRTIKAILEVNVIGSALSKRLPEPNTNSAVVM